MGVRIGAFLVNVFLRQVSAPSSGGRGGGGGGRNSMPTFTMGIGCCEGLLPALDQCYHPHFYFSATQAREKRIYIKTFISCYRLPGPSEGVSEGVFEGFSYLSAEGLFKTTSKRL